MSDWKDQIHRRIQGEKHELQTLPGHWFCPRKYSYDGAEVIQNINEELRKILKNSKAGEHIQKLRDKGIENPTIDDINKNLSEDELMQFYEELGDLGKRNTAELHRNMLLYGIGDHSFQDDEGKMCRVDEDLVNALFQSQELVLEMIPLIMRHNRPLAQKTSGESETSQNT